jgi:hypothetical protein
MMVWVLRSLGVAAILVAVSGCFGPEGMKTPEWNPDMAADSCMQQYDKDSDGFLDKKELGASPPLTVASPYLDTDNDKKLSRDEILARIKVYQENKVNKQTLVTVTVNGQPLMDAEVEFVPEDFLAEFIGPAHGSVVEGTPGLITMSSEGMLDMVQVGLYRVKVTSPTANVRPEYNEDTTLGIEVSPVTTPGQEGTHRFAVRLK